MGLPLQQFFSPAEIAVEEIAVEEIVAEEIVAEEIAAEEIAAEEIAAEEIAAEEIAAEEIAAEDSLEGSVAPERKGSPSISGSVIGLPQCGQLLLASTPVHSNQDRE